MLTPYSSEDLGRIFAARTLTKARTLILLGTVEVTLADPSVAIVIEHMEQHYTAGFTPAALDRNRVVLFSDCSCGQRACVHVAAGALAALDRFHALRRPNANVSSSSFRPEHHRTPASSRRCLSESAPAGRSQPAHNESWSIQRPAARHGT